MPVFFTFISSKYMNTTQWIGNINLVDKNENYKELQDNEKINISNQLEPFQIDIFNNDN
jgi:hypothetical protein